MTVCMQSVQLNLHNFKQSEDSYALTHRWEALCLQEMQLHVHTAFSFEEAHEKASFQGIYTRETRSSKENVAPDLNSHLREDLN